MEDPWLNVAKGCCLKDHDLGTSAAAQRVPQCELTSGSSSPERTEHVWLLRRT